MPRKSNESADANPFGKRVRRFRVAAGLTIAQVSQATGIGESVLSRLETNASYNPKLDTIRKLAEALGVKPADLIGD